ncbi:MAG: methyl-accepting chemotaxis protein [Bacteroidales bacterium]|nr:methyl-accepting chemotaxis protein [Bacteroidales bacterium]
MNKITHKIILLSLIPSLIIGLGVGLLFVLFTGQSSSSSIFAYEQTMRKDYDSIARWEVETVISLLNGIYEQQQSGNYTEEEAKKLAASLVRKLKYGNNGYFWIDTRKGLNIVSSVKANEGTNRLNTQDARGNYIIKNFIATAEKGGGYVNYWFPKTIGGKALPKRSYVALFEPYDWVIGTGNYIDDIDDAVNIMKNKQISMLYKVSAIIILMLLIAVVSIVIIGRKIARPIVVLSQKANQIAHGDLRVKIDFQSKDEIGILANALSKMLVQLNNIVLKIKNSADNIVSAGKYMSNASQQMSETSNTLAESTGQLSESVEEMSANIHSNTENSAETEKIANQIASDILSGSNAVNETSNAMHTITKEISVIDDIAFQTNILALNAEIEAARAGIHGKSFAIVAKEVNKLAVRSAEVAKKIDELSNSGTKISERSQEMLQKLVPEIQKTAVLVREITSGSKNQLKGAENITQEIQQLNRLAQQNAALSEETAVNSEELSNQAEELLKAIALFKI